MGCCSFIEDAIKDVGSKIEDEIIEPIKDVGSKIDDEILQPVVEIVKDAADWVVDDIIEPVARGAEDIVDAALDDPIATIAKIAAVASGNAWALPLIDGAAVAADGGDLGDVIKTAAVSYATGKISATTSKFINPEIAKAGLNSSVEVALQKGLEGGVKSATTAVVYGQDPLKAFATGGLNAAVGATLGQIADKIDTKFDNFTGDISVEGNPIIGGWENLQDGVKDSITAALTAELTGGEISSAQLMGIVGKYSGVSETMSKFLSENTGIDTETAEIMTSALSNAATVALAGNPELSSDAFFAKWNEYGVEAFKAIADKPVNSLIDKVTGASKNTETAADTLNFAINKAVDSAENFNGLREELNGKIQNQETLKNNYNNAVAAHNANPSDATANAANIASKTYNDYVSNLQTEYDTIYKPQMDAAMAVYNEYNPQIESLSDAYDSQTKYLMSDIDDLNADMKPVYDGVIRAAALALRPGIDEVSYRELNSLEADDDIYAHYLANQKEVDNVIATSAVTEYNNRYKEGAITVTELPPATRFKGDRDPTIPYVGRGGDPANYGLTEKDVEKYNLKTGAKDAWYNLVQGTQEMAGYTVGGFGRFVDELTENIVDSFGVDLSEANNIAYQQYAIYNDSNLTSEEKNQAMAKSMENYATAVDKAYAEDGADITFARDTFTDSMMNTLLAASDATSEKISPEMQARQYNALPAPDTTWEQLTSGKAKDRLGRPYGSDPVATLMSGVQELPDFAVDLALLALTKNPKFAAGLVMSSSSSEAFEANQQEIEGMLDSAFEFGQLQETPEFADLVRVYGGDEEAALAKLKDKSQVYSVQAGVVGGFGDLILAKVAGASGGASTLATVPTYLKPIITIGTGGLSEGITEAGEQGLVNEAIIDANLADNVVTTGAAAFVQGVSTGAQSTATFEAVSKAVNIARSYTTFDETDESRAAATAVALEGYKQRATVIDTLTEYGAFEGANNAIEVQERLAILGLDSKTAVEEIANDMFNNEVVTRAEVEAAVTAAEPEFNFTGDVAESIYEQFSGVRADSNLATEIAGYVDSRYFDVEEIKATAAAEGVTLTDEQAKEYEGQKDETAAVEELIKEYDPQATTYEEAGQFFIDYRYTPTETELQQYVGAIPETEQKAAISAYVDPRQTTEEEARQFFADQGYTPTDAEIAARVGQGGDTFETNTKTDVDAYVDPRQVTDEEARQFFADQGYEPTDEEVAARVSQGLEETFEADTEAGVEPYVNPRQVTAEEVTDAYLELGLTRPTDNDIQALVGQYMETDLAGKAEESLPTARYNSIINILDNLAGSTGETEVSDDVKDAIDVVKLDMINALGDLGLEVANIDKAVTNINDALGSPATEDTEATGVYADISDLNNLSSEDVQKIVDTAVEALPEGLSTEDVSGAINTALEGLENLSSDDVDTAITNALDNLNNLSSEDVESIVDTAVENVSDDVGDLTDVIGTAGVVDDPDTDVDETQDPTGLFATIKTYEDAGLDRDEALQKAIGDVASALNTTKTDLLSAVGETETSLVEQITDAETNLTEKFEAGISGVEGNVSELSSDLAALGIDIDTITDLIGKPAREVTETDVDFVIDLIAQENVSAELTAQYDVTGDGIVDINDQNMLSDSLQGNDVAFADTSMFNPATGLYLQQEQDTQATMDAITDLNSTITTNINTQERRREIAEAEDMLNQMSAMQQVSVRTPDPMNIDYLYDFNSIFANPNQEGLFGSPYGTNRQPANIPMQPLNRASGFAEGGQVEDENDRLLRLLGDLK